MRIANEILMHLRSMRRVRSEVSLYDPIGVDKEGNEIVLLDILGTDADVVADLVENKCENERLAKQMDLLTQREKLVLNLRFGIPNGVRRTQRDIAKMLGISRSYVSRIEKKAVERIGKKLNHEEES